MATVTPNFNWPVPTSTDLVKDGATAIEALGDSIDGSLVDLKGGTSGQVLAKNSNTDMDFVWVTSDDANAIQNTIVDAKGDLIAATAADTPARLAVGTNGHVLTADSTEATGIKWAAPAGGGKVLQVVTATTTTSTTVTTSTYIDSTLSVSITPSSATSKVMVFVTQQFNASRSGADAGGFVKIVRGGTDIFVPLRPSMFNGASEIDAMVSLSYLDSPATTSATTYKTMISATGGGTSTVAQRNSGPSVITLMEIGA
jgi:hypothetical protein